MWVGGLVNLVGLELPAHRRPPAPHIWPVCLPEKSVRAGSGTLTHLIWDKNVTKWVAINAPELPRAPNCTEFGAVWGVFVLCRHHTVSLWQTHRFSVWEAHSPDMRAGGGGGARATPTPLGSPIPMPTHKITILRCREMMPN